MNKKNIKIAHIVEGFIGGLATYMSHVLPKLVQEGYEITLICSLNRRERGMSDKLKAISDSGVTIRYVPMRRGITPLSDLYCFVLLFKLLRVEQYDIIHTHCSKAGFLGRIAARLTGVRSRLHSSHCFAYLRTGNVCLRSLFYWIERLLSIVTTRYIAVSASEVSNAFKSKMFFESKITLVENGIPIRKIAPTYKRTKTFKESLGIGCNAPIITTGCRFIGYKGLELLLQIACYVQRDCHFVIAGEGCLKSQLEKSIARNSLRDKVSILTPTVSMGRLLKNSDMAILCSRIEAQPYFLLEAMAARCPIIATDVPGNRELIGASRGLLVASDAIEIAKAIDTLLSDKSLRKHFADSAYRYVNNNHHLNRQIKELSQIYLVELKHEHSDALGINIDARDIQGKKAI